MFLNCWKTLRFTLSLLALARRIEASRALYIFFQPTANFSKQAFLWFYSRARLLCRPSLWNCLFEVKEKRKHKMLLNFFFSQWGGGRMGQSKLGWTWMKPTRLKVLKQTGEMPISLSPEICRLSVWCLFNTSTLKLKRGRTCPRLLMLSRGSHDQILFSHNFP